MSITDQDRAPYVGDGEIDRRLSAKIDREGSRRPVLLSWSDPRRDELLGSTRHSEDQAHRLVLENPLPTRRGHGPALRLEPMTPLGLLWMAGRSWFTLINLAFALLIAFVVPLFFIAAWILKLGRPQTFTRRASLRQDVRLVARFTGALLLSILLLAALSALVGATFGWSPDGWRSFGAATLVLGMLAAVRTWLTWRSQGARRNATRPAASQFPPFG